MKKFPTLVLALFAIATSSFGQSYIFYLHGKIVEDQGPDASNPAFGKYEYAKILATFRAEHFTVLSECRKPNTDVKEYAHKVVRQIDSLLKTGVRPTNITVVGASKGALIAMYVSTYLNSPKVNFVFLSSCSDYVFTSFPDIIFCGNVLSIYEKSDVGDQSCARFKTRSARTPHYKEIEVNTGLQHGYLYKPIPEWMTPTIHWANGEYN